MNHPSQQRSSRIFFACPISGHIDLRTSRLQPAYERFIRSVYRLLGLGGGHVFLALEREQWGQALMAPEICAPLDYAEMQRCDVVVAYPGVSCGVAVELGWASALRKPIILLMDDGTSPSPLVRGIGSLPGARVTMIDVSLTDGSPRCAGSGWSVLEAELFAALRTFQPMHGGAAYRDRAPAEAAASEAVGEVWSPDGAA